jgi:environmental stress-induced protein Ves
MNPLCIQADQVPPQAWRNCGGRTRELLVWPTPADWQLRISRADIAADGPFSAFAGVQRWFVVLSGNGVVLHLPTADGRTLDHTLLPGHAPLHFDGGLAPGCGLLDGATQDLNLMARGGSACMEAIVANHPWSADFAMRGLYTASSGTWSDGLQAMPLAAHSLLWIANASSVPSADFRFAAHDTEPTRAWWLGFTPDTSP